MKNKPPGTSAADNSGYGCWLSYKTITENATKEKYRELSKKIITAGRSRIIKTAKKELKLATCRLLTNESENSQGLPPLLPIRLPFRGRNTINQYKNSFIIIGTIGHSGIIDDNLDNNEKKSMATEGYIIKFVARASCGFIIVTGKTDSGVLYGVFTLIKKIQMSIDPHTIYLADNPACSLRIINQWDNMDGSIERGYAGNSIFYKDNKFTHDYTRIRDYARLLASTGINGIVLNCVNVRKHETQFLTGKYLPEIKALARLFGKFAITIYLSVNYASPIIIGSLPTADPLDLQVKKWWCKKVQEIYSLIPGFGGFVVKADSESQPGPFTYGRNHAEGANMLAEALAPYNGLVIWRCFVYNCTQDWRDKSIDRAKAAFDNFKPLDGRFLPNVVLQIKNGPVDFQIREPVSPLLGGLEQTNRIIEFQITQEYTGQQKHLCYLATQWQDILDFDTHSCGPGSTIKKIVCSHIFPQPRCGFAGVSNIGSDPNWTGHDLAQANLYAFGCLAWNPALNADEIAVEWIRRTFGNNQTVLNTLKDILMDSASIYESYTAPLGIGWMVNPSHHYGPNVDGYEYSRWGTYHRADRDGIGIDRSCKTGTGFAGLYHPPVSARYENPATCPDELILFFHHLPYQYKLKSGKTIIEHIYDSHFAGVIKVEEMISKWMTLKNHIDSGRYERILNRFKEQLAHACEWRDVINTYFYRKTGIPDKQERKIY